MRQRNRVEALSISAVVIITSSSYWRKTGIFIHADCGIAVANFKMNPGDPIVSCSFKEVVKKLAAYAFAVAAGQHGYEEEFRFVGDCSKQRKANRFLRITRLSENQ